MGKFKLINPVITGKFSDTFETATSDDAAKQFWESLTHDGKYLSNNVPRFLFTLQDTSNEELHHYMVKEKPEGSYADYTIKKVTATLTDERKTQFLSAVKKAQDDSEKMKHEEQNGGNQTIKSNLTGSGKHHKKRYKDDSSSSDDSDDDIDDMFKYIRLKNAIRPMSYWWYDPTLYKIHPFIPTFVAPIAPYVQLWTPQTTTWIPMR